MLFSVTDTIDERSIVDTSLRTNIVFSVTYYLESHNAITVDCISQFLVNKGQIGCLNIVKQYHLYLARNYINGKKVYIM